MNYYSMRMEGIMKLQLDIINLIKEKEPEFADVLISYIEDIEDNRVSNSNANERLMNQVERIVIEKNGVSKYDY